MHLYKVTFTYDSFFYVVCENEEKALEMAREKLKEACQAAYVNYDFKSLEMIDKKPLIQEKDL